MSMRFSWLCAVLVGGAALFSLSACSDSSDVGLGVGPEADSLGGGEPQTVDVLPALLDTTREVPLTGDNNRESPARSNWRFLVGAVEDPVTTPALHVEAHGYLDVAGRSSLPDEIATAAADSLTAELRLPVTYLHGMSEAPIAVEVYDLSEEAVMDSARADASFPADMGMPVSVDSAQVTPTDSLATIQLRPGWVADNLSVLKNTSNEGDSFEENFPGFKIVAPNSEAVVGFSSLNSALRLTYVPDTLTADYAALKSATHIDQHTTVSAPDGYTLLEGGAGVGLALEWAYGEADIRDEVDATSADHPPRLDSLPTNTTTSRAEIQVPVDTVAMNNRTASPNFSRPLPNGYRVLATRRPDADTPTCSSIFGVLGLALDEKTCALPLVSTAAPGAALVGNEYALSLFERSFQRIRADDRSLFTTFRVFIADRSSPSDGSGPTLQSGLPTTVPVLVPDRTAGGLPGPPRATLTVTPL
jgi:hypothetical protein